MKIKLIMLLLTAILFTGCGASDNTSKELSQAETENIATTQGGTDTQGESTAAAKENAATESEQEPYVLTFTGTTIDGETLTSDCFAQSKLTMINVWATYCNPCLNEMPDLGEIANEYAPEDFQMIGIVCDVIEGADEALINEAKELIEQTKADYPHLLLNGELYANLVGASDSVPTTYFFNQEGELLGYLVGAQPKEAWEGIINDLLGQME